MPHSITFEYSFKYLSLKGGIWIPAHLTVGDREVGCEAKIDTGADFCVFQRELADKLGLEVESGYYLKMSSAGGSVITYGHEVTIETLGLMTETTAFFLAEYGFQRNLLGQTGWLSHFKLGIIDYEETIYLSPYSQSQP